MAKKEEIKEEMKNELENVEESKLIKVLLTETVRYKGVTYMAGSELELEECDLESFKDDGLLDLNYLELTRK